MGQKQILNEWIEQNNNFWYLSLFHFGQLTKKKRIIKIENMLTHGSNIINSCDEETINEIQERYLEFNQHAQSYTWKVNFKRRNVFLEDAIYDRILVQFMTSFSTGCSKKPCPNSLNNTLYSQVIKNDEFVELNMERTLSQNGVEDESDKFVELGMPEDFFTTTLHIYFNDDLTYA